LPQYLVLWRGTSRSATRWPTSTIQSKRSSDLATGTIERRFNATYRTRLRGERASYTGSNTTAKSDLGRNTWKAEATANANPCPVPTTRNERGGRQIRPETSDLDGNDEGQATGAIRTPRGWAINVLHDAGAIRECEYHGWMQDRADPHAHDRAVELARQDPPPGVSPDAAVAVVREVLGSIGDTCPECPPD
jgi:hypothetical protein